MQVDVESSLTVIPAGAHSDALRRFLDRSPCPFARRAQIATGTPWPDSKPTVERLDRLASELRESIFGRGFHLAVIEIHKAAAIGSVAAGAGIVLDVLSGLRERDSTTHVPLLSGIEERGWDFEFLRERFFVSFFAPLYPSNHARWSGERDVAFVLLQPERGFRSFGISSKRPDRDKLSKKVHRRFQGRGQRYDLESNLTSPKSFRYVKPIAAQDPPVRWWEGA
jgi:hypothetical protein